jgi:hypothetical protein
LVGKRRGAGRRCGKERCVRGNGKISAGRRREGGDGERAALGKITEGRSADSEPGRMASLIAYLLDAFF